MTEITPYDPDPSTGMIPSANFMDTPRAEGDTCFAMALMLSYNQFAVTPTSDSTLRTFATSSPITFPTGMAGGMGRKGAQKVIIFETDGLPNCLATASLVNAGSYNYYKIRYDMNRPSASEYPSVQAYEPQRPLGLEPDLLADPAARYHLQHDAKPVPALRPWLWSRVPGPERQRGPLDSAIDAILRRNPEQCLHAAGVQSDRYRHRHSDVCEHGQCVYLHSGKRCANRTDQVTMHALAAEFVDVVKTYRTPIRSRPHGPGLAWGQLGHRTRRSVCTPGPQPGRQNDPAQDPSGLVSSQRRAACSGSVTRSPSGTHSLALATCTRTRHFRVT